MSSLFELIKKKEYNKLIKIIETTENIDINIVDEHNNYLILYAILYNNIELVKLLISRGARLDIFDQENYPILYYPIKFNNIEIINLLLEQDKNATGITILDNVDMNGRIPLFYAIKYKNKEIINLLIKSDMYKMDKNGRNALHYAILSRDVEVVKLILSTGIDINSTTTTGETALHIACNIQAIDIIEELLKNQDILINIYDLEMEYTPLHYAINHNNLEIINLLLTKKININIQDKFGNTPLHWAIKVNNESIIEKLIEKQADLNIWNIMGDTPINFLFSINLDNLTILMNILVLLIKDSNLNIQNLDGNSPLHNILQTNWTQYYDVLVNKKLNIFLKNKKNESPYDVAKNKERLLDLVASSYYNILKKNIDKKENYKDELDVFCYKNLNNESSCIKKYKNT